MAAAAPFATPEWHAPPNVRALFTMRGGGVSSAPYDALNLGTHVGDVPDAVSENRRRLRTAAGLPADPVWLRQVHGTTVVDLDGLAAGKIPEADAATTAQAGRVCVVLTADCLPVLFAAADGSAVAVAHAGWRGLAGGVLEATVAALRARIAEGVDLVCWIGPGISARHFEVREDVRDAFLATSPENSAAFAPAERGRWYCDLVALARRRLEGPGVTLVSDSGRCTYADDQDFFSHRRDVQHRGLAATGRSATLIWRTS